MPATAAFLYAMHAERVRWQRLEDARLAASFSQSTEHGRSWLLQKINLMLSGPGIVPRFEDALTPDELAGAREAQREADEAYERFRQAGMLVNADGSVPAGNILSGQIG